MLHKCVATETHSNSETKLGTEETALCWRRNTNIWRGLYLQARWV